VSATVDNVRDEAITSLRDVNFLKLLIKCPVKGHSRLDKLLVDAGISPRSDEPTNDGQQKTNEIDFDDSVGTGERVR
jgi:hypothetical protein